MASTSLQYVMVVIIDTARGLPKLKYGE